MLDTFFFKYVLAYLLESFVNSSVDLIQNKLHQLCSVIAFWRVHLHSLDA